MLRVGSDVNVPGHQDEKGRYDAHQNLKKVLKAPVTIFGLLMKRVNNDLGPQVKKLHQKPVRVTSFAPERLNRLGREVLEIQGNNDFGSGGDVNLKPGYKLKLVPLNQPSDSSPLPVRGGTVSLMPK